MMIINITLLRRVLILLLGSFDGQFINVDGGDVMAVFRFVVLVLCGLLSKRVCLLPAVSFHRLSISYQ